MPDPKLLAELQRALSTPHGTYLLCDEPQRLITKLHEAKRKAPDPSVFAALRINVSRRNPQGEVWIINHPEEKRDERPSTGTDNDEDL